MDADGDAGLEPTEAEVDADRLLALRTAWASLTGYAAWMHPAAGAAATALTPIFEKIATFAVKKLGERRVEHAAETLLDAADAADEHLAEFINKAVADDHRHELFARTLTIAQDTALRDKRRALGRALAAGVMGDDARVDEELLFIRAIADLDAPHIRLLALLDTSPPALDERSDTPPPVGWSVNQISAADPGLGDALPALLSTLELHVLVSLVPQGGLGFGSGERFGGPYQLTPFGRHLLARLADDEKDGEREGASQHGTSDGAVHRARSRSHRAT